MFATLAVVLAAVGIFRVMAYNVAQYSHEMGCAFRPAHYSPELTKCLPDPDDRPSRLYHLDKFFDVAV
jgi:hypothetical protein